MSQLLIGPAPFGSVLFGKYSKWMISPETTGDRIMALNTLLCSLSYVSM